MNRATCLDAIPCTTLKGVGPKVANHLKKLKIHTLQDLLFHMPLRYEDRTCFKSLNQLQMGDHVQVEGEIIHGAIQEGRRKSLYCRIRDDTGILTLRFFYFTSMHLQLLSRIGFSLRCYGEVKRGPNGYEMFHPEFHFQEDAVASPIPDTLTPIYPLTEGLNQYTLKKLTDQALNWLEEGGHVKEYLPIDVLERYGFPDLAAALKYVHRPPQTASIAMLNEGVDLRQQRLAFEELLAHQISLAKIRFRTRLLQAPPIQCDEDLVNRFLKNLPFSLTQAQHRVIKEIRNDLEKSEPMLRLVQGDVGSGKTLVAAVAALYMVQAGYQVALMAPTELLAEQHYKNFSKWCELIKVAVGWLCGGSKNKYKEEILKEAADGHLKIVIGTHALFQEQVIFSNLGLIIIDEQHRFGVDQRLALLHKGSTQQRQPHQLIMSATPIPRTLAMTAYADLDCSTVDELPPGRTPIKTIIIPSSKRDQLIERIRDSCKTGTQAYWVCTLIQESEVLQCQAAEEVLKILSQQLPELKIALLHGRMKAKEKEEIMASFQNKAVDLLVATTVIEVGVDVPNATLMIIENAERLGLAQLHQLRGRVGRGANLSYCVLMYQQPLSRIANERLSVIRDSNDGFYIAQKDLDLRGPGEMLGTKQTGLLQFKIANLARDQKQLPIVQEVAQVLLKDHPEKAELIMQRWLADNSKFSEV